MDLGTILGIWAHPDDEMYLCGGLMARAVREGDRVVCITATRGEAGSQDHERWPPSEMARIRTAELASSLSTLGVTEHAWLDYPDGGLAEMGDDEPIDRIASIIEEVRPDTVLTFGPEGMTAHPDHITISRWTTAAFRREGRDGAGLYYATLPPEWADRWAAVLRPFNVYYTDETPPRTPREKIDITYELPPDVLELKLAAAHAQSSQTEGLMNALGPFYEEALSAEFFRAWYPTHTE